MIGSIIKLSEFRSVVFLCLLFLASFNISSQNVYNLGSSYAQGLNLNKVSDREFGQTIPVGVQLNFHRQRDGNEYWEKLFNYPQTGWSLSWIDHQNKLLGNTFALSRYINYVFCRKKYFEAYLKLSQGIIYSTKFYETGSIENEHFNNAISQPVNFSEELGFGLNIYPQRHFGINLAATFMHFSNGALSQPNDGLNLLMFSAGINYVIGDREKLTFKQPVETDDDRSVKYTITVGSGRKQINPENEEKYGVFTLSFYADKKLSKVNALNLGVDVFMDRSVEYNIEKDKAYEGKDFKRIGISAGHEFFIGKVGILTQVGYHVYSPYPALSSFYQKFGFKYYITDLLFVTFTNRIFKFGISDALTWGIGVRL